MCLKEILQIFQKKPTTSNTPRKQVDSNYVYDIVRQIAGDNTRIYTSDNKYWLCTEADLKAFLDMDTTNRESYMAEEYDCDDFSYHLLGQLSVKEWAGIAAGIVWTDKHALNCFIDDTGKFWFIEPQNDKLQDTLEPWQGTEILFILM